jgi:hypothetical protein
MPRPTKLRAHIARLAMLKRHRPPPVPAVHQQAEISISNSSASIETSHGQLNEVEDNNTDSLQSADNSESSSESPPDSIPADGS